MRKKSYRKVKRVGGARKDMVRPRPKPAPIRPSVVFIRFDEVKEC